MEEQANIRLRGNFENISVMFSSFNTKMFTKKQGQVRSVGSWRLFVPETKNELNLQLTKCAHVNLKKKDERTKKHTQVLSRVKRN